MPYIRVWVLQGGKAGCVWAPSSLVSAAALLKWQELLSCCSSGSCSCSFFGQLAGGGRLWCRLQVQVHIAGWACSGCHARGRIRTAHLLEARLTHNTSTLPSPLPARCGNQSEGSPLHVRGSVAVLAGESGGTGIAIFRALAILFAPRGTRLIHSLLGPRSGSCAV